MSKLFKKFLFRHFGWATYDGTPLKVGDWLLRKYSDGHKEVMQVLEIVNHKGGIAGETNDRNPLMPGHFSPLAIAPFTSYRTSMQGHYQPTDQELSILGDWEFKPREESRG